MLLRHFLAVLLLPFMATFVVPRWLLGSFAGNDTRWLRTAPLTWVASALGALLFLCGLAVFLWCVLLFARVGRGTLAPWDPTQKLVAVGPYRYVRNPMISAVATMLAGQCLFFGSWILGAWFLLFILVNHIYFLLSEEPGLERRFGESYREYKCNVPRWVPRRRWR
jgi:protein-S-isoprenylcysteine O-methyltransferase Ste14